jgi:acyl-CoA thioester hydrolase
VTTEAEYGYRTTISTRWMDNDMYGHVNNVQYYSFFDTALTEWLIREGGLDPAGGEAIGLCVESQCTYTKSLTFPETVTAGLRVGHVGRSSVRYEIALWGSDDETPAATGYFVHVMVDRTQRTPVAIPDHLRRALAQLATSSTDVPAPEHSGQSSR